MSDIRMASEITSSPATEELQTQTESERLLMPQELITAAMEGNGTYLNELLGLNFEDDNPHHRKVSVDDVEPSDCLIRSANGNIFFFQCKSNNIGDLLSAQLKKKSKYKCLTSNAHKLGKKIIYGQIEHENNILQKKKIP